MDEIDRLPRTALVPVDPEFAALCERAMQETYHDPLVAQTGPTIEQDGGAGWRIDDDGAAEWAMARVGDIDDEIVAVTSHAEAMRDRIDAWVSERLDARCGPFPSLMESRAFFTSHLEWYGLRQREEKGRKTVPLVGGDIATTEHKPKVEIVDEQALMDWAVDNLPDVIRVRTDVLVTTLREWVKPTPDGSLLLTDADPAEDGPARPDVVVDAIPGVALSEPTVTAKVKPR